MRITWHGHSFFELEADGTNVLIDPFLEGNPAIDATPSDFDADIVAVTHGHHDHSGDAHRFDATVVCQPEVAEYLEQKGAETVGMNIGGTYEEAGVELTMTKAFHSSGASGDGQFDRYGGTPAGYVIDDGETSFYHSGDTGLFGDMKTVIREVYAPDIAAVPIGDHFTIGPEDAATAVEWLGVDDAFPMHYDTFPPIEQNPEEFAEAVEEATIHVPEAGETVEL
jgi:L-ascorbate metabolism protein UlaG (beta-lactamase superfamily)